MTNKKKILVRTVITPITKDGNYKPKSPLFEFINDGFTNVTINNNYFLLPGDGFGISADPIVAEFLLKGMQVEMDTTYSVQLGTGVFKSCKLIETFITLE